MIQRRNLYVEKKEEKMDFDEPLTRFIEFFVRFVNDVIHWRLKNTSCDYERVTDKTPYHNHIKCDQILLKNEIY